MKKEEFFDTLGDVEQKYINEAFFDDLDDSPSVAKPGKARITPLKILAPIAAVLAVAVGAGVAAPHLSRLAAERSESSAAEEIAPNMNMLSDFERGAYTPTCDVNMDFTPEDLEKQFIFDCCGIVAGENPDIIGDVTSWRVIKTFGLGDARYFYFIIPQIDGRAIPEIGVRVFNKVKVLSTAVGETYRLGDRGSFGMGYADIDLEHRPTTYDTYYYYRIDKTEDYMRESIQMLSISPKTDEITETTMLEKFSYEDRELYKTGYGNSISKAEFIGRWNNYPYIPKIYTEFTAEEADECRELLKANHDIPDDWKDCWREAERDIDLDGTKELLLAPQQCDIMGIYVFAKTADGLKEVGSFDTETLRSIREINYTGSAPEKVWYRNVSGDNYFPYYEILKIVDSSDSRMSVTQASINKILVDENGVITLVPFLERGTEILDEKEQTSKRYYRLNGEDITEQECSKEWNKYIDYSIESTSRSTTIPVPTDPANKAW
ncbi:MAG: hypothetical protein K2J77_02805 [Oscillospiraceae bacterium]|nr:hypothetical protein [Oscillospiraceae bacterium]